MTELKKYEFTGETLEYGGKTLRRIRAVRDFGNVKSGELGGWIESEENLSHSGNARVFGNARVSSESEIKGRFDCFCLGPIGSRSDFVTFYRTKGKGLGVSTGCFSGTVEKFLDRVKKTHGDNEHAVRYRAAVELAKQIILFGREAA